MSNDNVLADAMRAAGYTSVSRFGSRVLGVDGRTARRWWSGERVMPGALMSLCRAIIATPDLAREIADERAKWWLP